MSTRHFGLSSGAGRDPAPLWLAANPSAFFLPSSASPSVAARFPATESLDPAGRQGMRPGHLQRAPSHPSLIGGDMALDKPGRTLPIAGLAQTVERSLCTRDVAGSYKGSMPATGTNGQREDRGQWSIHLAQTSRATGPYRAPRTNTRPKGRTSQCGHSAGPVPAGANRRDSRRDGTHLTSPARWMGFCRASDTRQREPGMSSRDGGRKPGARDSRRDGTHSPTTA